MYFFLFFWLEMNKKKINHRQRYIGKLYSVNCAIFSCHKDANGRDKSGTKAYCAFVIVLPIGTVCLHRLWRYQVLI